MVVVTGSVMVVVTWLWWLLPLFLRMARARACATAAAASAHVLRVHECVRVRLRLPPGLWCRRLLVVHVASVFPCVSSAHVTLWCSMPSVAGLGSSLLSFSIWWLSALGRLVLVPSAVAGGRPLSSVVAGPPWSLGVLALGGECCDPCGPGSAYSCVRTVVADIARLIAVPMRLHML